MSYWNDEKPVVIDTGKNVLRYYKNSDKLQVSAPNWKDDNGVEKQGKTVTLDIAAVHETSEAIELLKQIAE